MPSLAGDIRALCDVVEEKLQLVAQLQAEGAAARTQLALLALLQRVLQETVAFRARVEHAAAATRPSPAGLQQGLQEHAWLSDALRAACQSEGAAAVLADATAFVARAVPHLAEGQELIYLEGVDEASLIALHDLPWSERRMRDGRMRQELAALVAALEAKGWDNPAALGMRARLASLGREWLRMDSAQFYFRPADRAAIISRTPSGEQRHLVGSDDHPQAVWDDIMANAGFAREQVDLLLACAAMLQRRLERLGEERAALCSEMAALCGAGRGGGAAVEPSCGSSSAGVIGNPAGTGAAESWWARAIAAADQPSRPPDGLAAATSGAGGSGCAAAMPPSSPRSRQAAAAAEAVWSAPPLDALSQQVEILEAMEANTRRMGLVLCVHSSLLYALSTDLQRAYLLGRAHPATVNVGKVMAALRHLVRTKPETFAPAAALKLEQQQASWLAAREEEVKRRKAQHAAAAQAEAEARERLAAMLAGATAGPSGNTGAGEPCKAEAQQADLETAPLAGLQP